MFAGVVNADNYNSNDPSLITGRCHIGGSWVEAVGGASIAVENPANGENLGRVPDCGRAETEMAIAAAARTFGPWSGKAAGEHATLLERWHDLVLESSDDLALLMTLEQGKPLAESRAEISCGASPIKWFAEEARRVHGETIPSPSANGRILVQKQPVGVVAAITPWNSPNAMITRKAAPALAAGCSVVIKPSELTPFSALVLGVLAERAGIPAGVINIVTGDAAAIGAALTESPTVRKLTFTGSTRVGKGLAAFLYTRDVARCFRVADALEVGMIGINRGSVSYAAAPFGGVKESGLGREGSRHSIEEFLEMKTLRFGGL